MIPFKEHNKKSVFKNKKLNKNENKESVEKKEENMNFSDTQFKEIIDSSSGGEEELY